MAAVATSRKTALAISIAAVLILTLPFAPRASAFVYWANNGSTTIGRANLDGTGASQAFVGGAINPCGVAVDAAHLYWATGGGGTIGRASVDWGKNTRIEECLWP